MLQLRLFFQMKIIDVAVIKSFHLTGFSLRNQLPTILILLLNISHPQLIYFFQLALMIL